MKCAESAVETHGVRPRAVAQRLMPKKKGTKRGRDRVARVLQGREETRAPGCALEQDPLSGCERVIQLSYRKDRSRSIQQWINGISPL